MVFAGRDRLTQRPYPAGLLRNRSEIQQTRCMPIPKARANLSSAYAPAARHQERPVTPLSGDKLPFVQLQ